MQTPTIDPCWWRTGTWNGRPVREALAERDIESVFGFLRRHGISRTRLAALTGLSETRVRLIAKGKQQVSSYDVLERISDGLAIPRHYLGLGYAPDEITRSITGIRPAPADMDGRDTPSSLRCLLTALAGTVDMGQLPSLRSAVGIQLQLLAAVRDDHRGRTHRVFLATEATWWEFLSWIEDNSSAPAAGIGALNTALRLALEAEDPALAGYVLMRQSQQAIDLLDHSRAIELASRAQRQPGLSVQARALVAIREAEAHALRGNAAVSGNKIDDAMAMVTASADNDPACAHCTPDYVAAHEAHCRLLLGEPARAVEAFERILAEPHSRSRLDEGLWRAQLAIAHAEAGSPDRAGHQVSAALDLAAQTGSTRVARTIDSAVQALSRYSGVLDTSDIDPRLRRLVGARCED